MDQANGCPRPELLQEVLLGRADDTDLATWERHISNCRECLERAASLPDDPLIRSVRRAAGTIDTPELEVVSTIVTALRRLHTDHSQNTASWSDTNSRRLPLDPDSAFLSVAESADEIGRLGPYTIQKTLGSGGMGVVYRGYDSRLRRTIAIKVIRPELLSNVDMSRRFLAEARAAAAVENDHIVAVHAVEEHGGVPCITMPLLQGETLDKRLRNANAPLSLRETIRLARGVATGLAAAHAIGMVHRDIKPANLWLERPNDRVKILDFGLALPAEAAGSESRFAGTPGYMAPEQARGRPIDERADLFSLGCVLYQAATGNAPFSADTPIGRIVRTVSFEPIASRIANPQLPIELANLIDELLAKSPEDRPATAADVLKRLESIEAAFDSRRKRTLRRRVAGSVAAALLLGGLGTWAGMLATAPKPVPPVAIVFDADADVGPLVVARDGLEWRVEPADRKALELAPGDYTIRAATPRTDRELVPSSLVVLPNEAKTVRLALVGEIAKSYAHSGAVTGIAIVSDGAGFAILSTSLDRTFGSWRPQSIDPPRFANLSSPANLLATSHDGSMAAITGGNKSAPYDLAIHRWNGRTLAPIGPELAGHKRRCTALGASPNGRQLISAAPGELRLWDLATETRRELVGHAEHSIVLAVAFDSARAQAMTGGDDGYAILWDLAEAKPIRKFVAQAVGSSGAVRAIAYIPNGFLTAGDDRVLRVWNRDTFRSRDLATVDSTIRCLAVSGDGQRFLTGDERGDVKLWSTRDGTLLRAFRGHGRPVRGVAFAPDGRAAASGGEDRTVRLWRLPR